MKNRALRHWPLQRKIGVWNLIMLSFQNFRDPFFFLFKYNKRKKKREEEKEKNASTKIFDFIGKLYDLFQMVPVCAENVCNYVI